MFDSTNHKIEDWKKLSKKLDASHSVFYRKAFYFFFVPSIIYIILSMALVFYEIHLVFVYNKAVAPNSHVEKLQNIEEIFLQVIFYGFLSLLFAHAVLLHRKLDKLFEKKSSLKTDFRLTGWSELELKKFLIFHANYRWFIFWAFAVPIYFHAVIYQFDVIGNQMPFILYACVILHSISSSLVLINKNSLLLAFAWKLPSALCLAAWFLFSQANPIGGTAANSFFLSLFVGVQLTEFGLVAYWFFLRENSEEFLSVSQPS